MTSQGSSIFHTGGDGKDLLRSFLQTAPMAIATIGLARRRQLPAGRCIGSDEIGHIFINSADSFFRIGLFARARPISSKLDSVCLRILLSFEHCDRTEFQRAIANRRNCKSAEKNILSGDGGTPKGKLQEGARFCEAKAGNPKSGIERRAIAAVGSNRQSLAGLGVVLWSDGVFLS